VPQPEVAPEVVEAVEPEVVVVWAVARLAAAARRRVVVYCIVADLRMEDDLLALLGEGWLFDVCEALGRCYCMSCSIKAADV